MNSDYKIEAKVKDGDSVMIFTDDRERARHYAGLLLGNRAYSLVTVVKDGQLYMGEAIGKMP